MKTLHDAQKIRNTIGDDVKIKNDAMQQVAESDYVDDMVSTDTQELDWIRVKQNIMFYYFQTKTDSR